MLLDKKVPDLIGGIETDWFVLPYWNDLEVLHPRNAGHHFREAFEDGIGHLGIARGGSGNEYSGRKSRLLQCRRAFEEEVVRIEVLHEDDFAWTNILRAYNTPAYRRNPQPARQRPYEND